MSVPNCFDYCSFVVSFETGKNEFSDFVLFQACFRYLGSLEFHINLRTDFFISEKRLLEF